MYLSRKLSTDQYVALTILILTNLTILWLTAPIWQQQNLNDDSFITLTYAKNLAHGNGFVYNHPPATLGTTTPFFALLTALLAIILPFLTVVEAGILLSIIAWIGTGWGIYLIMRHLDFKPISSAVSASIAILPATIWLHFVGMEIWLFQFLLVLSVWLSVTQKPFYAGVTIGALYLTRGEGILVGLILVGYFWLNQRKIPKDFIAGIMVILAIWFVYAMITFGTFIPNTLAAKQAQAQIDGAGPTFVERIVLNILPNIVRHKLFFGHQTVNLYFLLIVLGFIHAVYKNKKLLIFPTWAIIYLTAYTILNPKPYFWYILHVVFIFQLLAGIGLGWLFEVARKNSYISKRVIINIGAVILTVAFLYPYITSFSQDFSGDDRATTYKAISTWLNQNSCPEQSVAYIEIGYLGYFTDNRIIDLAGLIDPTTTQHLVTDGFEWGFWHYQPDYYIYAEEFDWALGGIKSAINDYTIAHEVPRDGKFSTPIYIFQRKRIEACNRS